MRTKAIVLCCLIGAIVLFAGLEYSSAKPKADKAVANIGVVSIQKIFDKCKRSVRYREEATTEQSRVFAEMDKLAKEIDADKVGLKTLKAGSSDHLALVKGILEKQANLQARQEFYKQQMALKQQRMIEDIYGDILRITSEVARQKGLDLVFERSEPELPTLNANELEMVIGTHKLLYSGGCLDITDEVMVRLDAVK